MDKEKGLQDKEETEQPPHHKDEVAPGLAIESAHMN